MNNGFQSMSTEIEIMKRIRHRSIVSMYELFKTPKCIWMIVELTDGGDLRHLIAHKTTEYNEVVIARQMKQILSGIHYLHSLGKNILHIIIIISVIIIIIMIIIIIIISVTTTINIITIITAIIVIIIINIFIITAMNIINLIIITITFINILIITIIILINIIIIHTLF